MQFLGENEIPFCIVFTKTDKLGKTVVQNKIAKYKKVMLKTWEEMPTYFLTSATDQTGKKEVLEFIDTVNNSQDIMD